MIIEVPPFKVEVDVRYMTDFQNNGTEEGYVQAIKVTNNDCMRFLVHTEYNAIYSWLPIEAIFYDNKKEGALLSTSVLQPYTCLEAPAQYFVIRSIEGADVMALLGDDKYEAVYLFTVDYMGDGLASDPVQSKTHNVCYIKSSGQLCAVPNNKMLIGGSYVSDSVDMPKHYRRQTKRYFAGE
jgi:hypothetical protein